MVKACLYSTAPFVYLSIRIPCEVGWYDFSVNKQKHKHVITVKIFLISFSVSCFFYWKWSQLRLNVFTAGTSVQHSCLHQWACDTAERIYILHEKNMLNSQTVYRVLASLWPATISTCCLSENASVIITQTGLLTCLRTTQRYENMSNFPHHLGYNR